MHLPGAIIFVNKDLTQEVLSVIQRQLYIDTTFTLDQYMAYLIAHPTYVDDVHKIPLRVLVIVNDIRSDSIDRNTADIVCFVKNGRLDVEWCKYGPPGESFQIPNLTIFSLLKANKP